MKYIFLINPMSGKRKGIEKLKDSITHAGTELQKDFEIYVTKSVGDAENYVRQSCMQANEPTTYIACGGDGTFNEVLNGAVGFDNAYVSVIPTGTGNDFCRNFEDCDFLNIKSQFNEEYVLCDAIRYKGVVNGQNVEKYCANMFNIGFDCNVADKTSTLKKFPLIKGSLAYFLSIFVMLLKKKGANFKLEIDGREVHNGKLLLTSIANGCYCGGGIKSNPYAKVNDGLMDVNIIKDVPRRMFIPCLPKYMKGTIFDTDKYAHFASTVQCKNITITPNEKMRICVDGEIYDSETIEFTIAANIIKLVKTNNYHNKGEKNYEKNTVSG